MKFLLEVKLFYVLVCYMLVCMIMVGCLPVMRQSGLVVRNGNAKEKIIRT